MRSFLRPLLNNTLLFCVVFQMLLLSCSGGGNKTKPPVQENLTDFSDSSFIFDGKTLEGWEITDFGPQGPVYVSGGSVILGMGDGCTGITYQNEFPTINYKLTLEAKRVSGTDFFCGITFPVEDEPLTLVVGGWGGSVVGLSSVNRMDASENETTKYMNFEKDQWYSICLIVKEDTIKALIDNIIVVDFAIGNNSLSIRPEVELSKPFGITSWTTTAAIRNIRVEKLKDINKNDKPFI